MKHLIVGTAGHIDHGKTSLIKSLTGVDTDRLKEEKIRGITIELGFTHLDLPGGEMVGIVDVPGHERFVRQMVAGAAGIDLVMLVVAADEGVMPQTREHLDICALLGVKKGLVVLTKTDLVDNGWLELVESDLREFLKGTFLEHAPIIRVSAATGRGMEEIKTTLSNLVGDTIDRSRQGYFRLPVDRVFTMKGFGTVVTGTTAAGVIGTGEEIEVLPGGKRGRVRGIQVYGQKVEEAIAGQRTALNLQGFGKGDIPRGSVVVRPKTFLPANGFYTDFFLLPSARRLKEGARVRFHIGTDEVMSRCYPLEGKEIVPGKTAIVNLRLERSTVAAPGDRFVIRSYSPMVTLGGGEILSVWDGRRRRRKEVVQELKTVKEGSPIDLVRLAANKSGSNGIDLQGLADALKMTPETIRPWVEEAVKSGDLIRFEMPGSLFVDKAVADRLTGEIQKEVDDYLQGHPLEKGAPVEVVRSKVKTSDRVFEGLMAGLGSEGVLERRDNFLVPPGHRPAVDDQIREKLDQLTEAWGKMGLTPDDPGEVLRRLKIDPGKGAELINYLVDHGSLVRVKEDYLIAAKAATDLVGRVRNFLTDRGEMSVAEFKELTGTSRKYTIPLMEYLDRTRITIRVGEVRRLRKQG